MSADPSLVITEINLRPYRGEQISQAALSALLGELLVVSARLESSFGLDDRHCLLWDIAWSVENPCYLTSAEMSRPAKLAQFYCRVDICRRESGPAPIGSQLLSEQILVSLAHLRGIHFCLGEGVAFSEDDGVHVAERPVSLEAATRRITTVLRKQLFAEHS